MKITADLKCFSCGRVWATTQGTYEMPFTSSPVRTIAPELLPPLAQKSRRCPRCGGTLVLEIIEAEEYYTDRLMGA